MIVENLHNVPAGLREKIVQTFTVAGEVAKKIINENHIFWRKRLEKYFTDTAPKAVEQIWVSQLTDRLNLIEEIINVSSHIGSGVPWEIDFTCISDTRGIAEPVLDWPIIILEIFARLCDAAIQSHRMDDLERLLVELAKIFQRDGGSLLVAMKEKIDPALLSALIEDLRGSHGFSGPWVVTSIEWGKITLMMYPSDDRIVLPIKTPIKFFGVINTWRLATT